MMSFYLKVVLESNLSLIHHSIAALSSIRNHQKLFFSDIGYGNYVLASDNRDARNGDFFDPSPVIQGQKLDARSLLSQINTLTNPKANKQRLELQFPFASLFTHTYISFPLRISNEHSQCTPYPCSSNIEVSCDISFHCVLQLPNQCKSR